MGHTIILCRTHTSFLLLDVTWMLRCFVFSRDLVNDSGRVISCWIQVLSWAINCFHHDVPKSGSGNTLLTQT